MALGITGGIEFIYQFLDFFFAFLIISNMIGVFALHGDVVVLVKEFFRTPGKYYLLDKSEKEAARK